MVVRLREFGVPWLEAPDGTVLQRGGKPLVLLLWLAHVAGRRYLREELAELFWPDDPPLNARKSLRQALTTLRRWVGPEALVSTGDWLWLAEGACPLDAPRFRQAVRAGDWAQACALMHGPWASGAEHAGGARLERWVFGERRALLAEFEALAEREVNEALTAGDHAAVRAIAQAAEALGSSHEPLMRAHVEACCAQGDFVAARTVLARYVAADEEGGAMTASLQRLERRLREQAAAAEGALGSRPGERLIGRDEELAIIFRALARARQQAPQRVLVTGAAGMGKTRLLDEFEARLQSYAVRKVRITLDAEMHEVPGAMLTAVVRALGLLSGAAGITADAAAILVRLTPDLQPRFPGVKPWEGPLALAATTGAVRDLLQAVAEERPTVLLLDDAQHADAWSWRIWCAVRVAPPAALLEVTASRRADDGPGWTVVPLPPLDADALRTLLAEVALLPASGWADTLVRTLRTASRGIPGRVLQTLQVLGVRGALTVRAHAWQAAEPVQIAEDVEHAAGEGYGPVSAAARALYAMLQLWRRPLAEETLLALAAECWPETAEALWRPAAQELERNGLIVARHGAWVCADVDAEGTPVSPVELPRILLALVGALPTDGAALLPASEHLLRLAGVHDAFDVAVAVVRYLAQREVPRALGLYGRPLAQHAAEVAGRPTWTRPLYRAMGLVARRSTAALLGLGALAATALSALGALLVLWQPRLVVESTLMAGGPQPGDVGLQVQPRVAVVDGFGRLRPNWSIPVRVESRQLIIHGDTLRRTDSGRVQFERLSLQPIASPDEQPRVAPTMIFRGPWWVRSAEAEVWGLTRPGVKDQFRVVRAASNGRPVGRDRVVYLSPGEDSLDMTLTFEYTTTNTTANYVVGAGPVWLPRESSVVRLAGLPRPVLNGWQTVRFVVPTPRAPGRYPLIIAMKADDSVNHLFSSTYWGLGLPIWNDGNDIHDLNTVERAFLRDSGWISLPQYVSGNYTGPQGTYNLSNAERRVGGSSPRPTRAKVSVVPEHTVVMGSVFDVIVSDNAAQRRVRLDPTQYPTR